jgi:hypothetical protein
MSHLFSLRPVTALLGVVLAAGVVAVPAQASPRGPDPELARPAAADAQARRPAVTPATATIDSDVNAVTTSPGSVAYFVVAGRLQLHLKSGSTTRYTGSLVDYVGNKAYEASADATNASAPKLTFTSRNGTLSFVLDSSLDSSSFAGTASSIPSKLKVSASKVFLSAAPHTAGSASYTLTLSERSGPLHNPLEYVGTLTLIHDAYGRVSGGSVTVSNSKGKNVTHSLSNSGFSNGGYFYTVAKIDSTYFGLTGTFNGSSFKGYGFAGSGSTTSQWILTAQ